MITIPQSDFNEMSTHILDEKSPFDVAPPPPPRLEGIHQPATLFGKDDSAIDPAVEELVRTIGRLEEENTQLRETLQDAQLTLQKKTDELRKLQNVALQTKRALTKLTGFVNTHIL